MDNLDNYTINNEEKKDWMNGLKKFVNNTNTKYTDNMKAKMDILKTKIKETKSDIDFYKEKLEAAEYLYEVLQTELEKQEIMMEEITNES